MPLSNKLLKEVWKMSKVIDFKNPPEPELSEQDKELLAWLQSTPKDELSKAMSDAMDEVDSDLFKGVF